MGRAWEPGDIALVTYGDGNVKQSQAICGRRALDDSLAWVFPSGVVRDVEGSIANRLIVLTLGGDRPWPGDRERRTAAEMLIAMLRETADTSFKPEVSDLARVVADQIEHQTQEPAPPKPPEPLGVGAVVECDPGPVYDRAWAVRVWEGDAFSGRPWYWHDSSGNGGPRYYADLPVLRVTSEGEGPEA